MMTITPTRRTWLGAPGFALAVTLASLCSGAVLLLVGLDPATLSCVAPAP